MPLPLLGVSGLSVKLFDQIVRKIRDQKPVAKIILFGSRARGDHQISSDIDLAILDSSWTSRDINLVKDKLEEEIKTPLKFDLVHWNRLVKKTFKNKIMKEGRVLYESRTNP